MTTRARVLTALCVLISIAIVIVGRFLLAPTYRSPTSPSLTGPGILPAISAPQDFTLGNCVDGDLNAFGSMILATTTHRSLLGFQVTIPSGWCVADPSAPGAMFAYDPTTCHRSSRFGLSCERYVVVQRGIYTSITENVHQAFETSEATFSRSNELELRATRRLVPGAVAIYSHSDEGGLPVADWTILFDQSRLSLEVGTGQSTFETTTLLPTLQPAP